MTENGDSLRELVSLKLITSSSLYCLGCKMYAYIQQIYPSIVESHINGKIILQTC